MIQTISNDEFNKNIAHIYWSIFASEDPFGAPFQQRINKRLLLYKIRYGLTESDPWLIPMIKSIKTLGEKGFYVSLLGVAEEGEPAHWYVPLDEAHLYIDVVFPVQNAIYSVNGTWGVICSDEDHAVLGGPEVMSRIIQESVTDWEPRIRLFLQDWKRYHQQNDKIILDWIPRLFTHVYGNRIPDFIMNDVGLRELVAPD